jgi:Zn-dependent protease
MVEGAIEMDDFTPLAPAATYPSRSASTLPGEALPPQPLVEPGSSAAQPVAASAAAGQLAPRQGAAKIDGEPFGGERRGLFRRIGSALAGLGALAAKFGVALKALVVALPNAKIFLTAGTALVSVVLYSLFWGWWFAVGFVVLLFVHEMGHVIALRREGIRASAPMFVPFMGAVITSRSLGENALAEARVGLAGPLLGSLGAAAVAVVGWLTHSEMLLALAYVGFLVNLFNLLPVVPLDGGRAMAAMAPWMWFVGFGALLVLAFTLPSNPVLWIIVLFGGFELYRRWQARKSGSAAQATYYRVAPHHRLLVAVVYIGLAAALAFGMSETHILSSGGHSFNL